MRFFKKRNESIKNKILSSSLSIIILSLILVSCISGFVNLRESYENAESSFKSIVSLAGGKIELELDKITSLISEISSNKIFQEIDLDDPFITNFLENKAREHNFKSIYFTDINGKSNIGKDFSSYEFFKEAQKGNIFLTEPQISSDKTYADIMLSAPIRSFETNEIIGTICAVMDSKDLTNLISETVIGKTGSLYIIDKEGYTIADKDYENVLSRENTINDAKLDKSLTQFAEAEKKSLNGEDVFTEANYNGTKNLLATMPIYGTNGWVLGAFAPATEFLGGAIYSGIITILLLIGMSFLASVIMITLAKKIVNPIVEISHISDKLSSGDFNVSIKYESKDEIGIMADNFRKMIVSNKDIIHDTSRILKEISSGNLEVKIDENIDYCGDFAEIKTAIEEIIKNLNKTITAIKETAILVNTGSDQVSAGAVSLSQGSQEQAAAVEELSASLQEISNQVEDNAKNATYAKELANQCKNKILDNSEKMKTLNEAIINIEKKQNEIKNIIKTIDDIAFQTNILALNASVEAARAGESGKGFAVVAGEVRNLAQKVANAAKNTNDLITTSVDAVKEGAKIAHITSEKLDIVVKDTLTVVNKINEISDASISQAYKINEATIGIEQVASVVQSNSATAEESAAIAESMNEQANKLQTMVNKFKIKEKNFNYLQESLKRNNFTKKELKY